MMNFKKRNYKFWHSPIALVFLFFILLFFGYRIIDLIQKERETARDKELILDKINELQNKEASLKENISKLKTEEGKEEIIREKYQVAKQGEKMVIIVDGEKSDNIQSQAEVVNHGFLNWVKRIFKK